MANMDDLSQIARDWKSITIDRARTAARWFIENKGCYLLRLGSILATREAGCITGLFFVRFSSVHDKRLYVSLMEDGSYSFAIWESNRERQAMTAQADDLV